MNNFNNNRNNNKNNNFNDIIASLVVILLIMTLFVGDNIVLYRTILLLLSCTIIYALWNNK